MSRRFVRLVLAFVFSLVVLTIGRLAAGPPKESSLSQEVESLLKQRLEVLAEIAKMQREAYRGGEAAVDDALHAEADLAAAKIELAKTAAERVSAHEELVKLARQIEEVAERLVRSRERRRSDHLKAKAFRLQAEANLLRARSARS
jgi:outer membrane protein TolC